MKVIFQDKSFFDSYLNHEYDTAHKSIDFMKYFNKHFSFKNNYIEFYNSNHIHSNEILAHGLFLFSKAWSLFSEHIRKQFSTETTILVTHSCCYFLPFLMFNKRNDLQITILKNFFSVLQPLKVDLNISFDTLVPYESVYLNKNKLVIYNKDENELDYLGNPELENIISEYLRTKNDPRGRKPLHIQQCEDILFRRKVFFDVYLISSIEYQLIKQSYYTIREYCYRMFNSKNNKK